MTRIEIKARVGPDGVLSLVLPSALANYEVLVTVQPMAALRQGQTKEWLEFTDSTAGQRAGEPISSQRAQADSTPSEKVDAQTESWQEFVEQTYGSCADLGLEEPLDPAPGVRP